MRPRGEMAALAMGQHGVVSHGQLLALGYSRGAIGRLAGAGWLHRLHRGVYAVGHAAVSRHGLCLAAVLACGENAVASHQSAAWLWGLSPRFAAMPHVTAPRRGHVRATIHLHHSTIFEEADLTTCDGVPVTSVPRTSLDMAAVSARKGVEGLLEKAERMSLLEVTEIEAILARSGRHPGRRILRQALAIYRDPVMTRARSERLLLAIVRRAGLPRPAINYSIAGMEIDAYWETERFAVEVDGYATHGTRAAFERDPLRIEELKLLGIDAIRITASRIEREPSQVGQRLRALLQARRRALHPRR